MKLPKPTLSPLAEQVAEFFRLRGFALHKCCTSSRDGRENGLGGVCLTEEPDGGVLVGWAPSTRLRYADSTSTRADVIGDMLRLFWEWLDQAGYLTEMGPLSRSVRVLSVVPTSERKAIV